MLKKGMLVKVIKTNSVGKIVMVLDRLSDDPYFVVHTDQLFGELLGVYNKDELIRLDKITRTPIEE